MRWPRLWPFLAAGLFGVPIGTALLEQVQVQPLKLGVGMLLIFYSAWMAFVRRPPVITGGGRPADAAVGFVGGVMGGLASVSGPAPTIWVQLRGWNKNEQRGVNQPFNMAVLAAALVAAAVAGLLDRTFLVWAIITVPTSLVGARLGLMLYGRVNDASLSPARAGAAGAFRTDADRLVAAVAPPVILTNTAGSRFRSGPR